MGDAFPATSSLSAESFFTVPHSAISVSYMIHYRCEIQYTLPERRVGQGVSVCPMHVWGGRCGNGTHADDKDVGCIVGSSVREECEKS